MTDKETFKEFLTSKPVAFYPDFSEIGGSTNAGVLLSQLFYWRDKEQDPDGWVYKSQKDWKREISLTRTEQETARKKLRDAKILQEKLKGNPAKLYFRIDFDKMIEALAALYEARRQDAETLHAGNLQSKDAGKPQASMQEISKLSFTENTTKTTSENTTTAPDGDGSALTPEPKVKPSKRKNTYPAKEMADIFEKGYPALHAQNKFPWGKESGKWGKAFQRIWEQSGENMEKVKGMATDLFRRIKNAKPTDLYWKEAGFTPTTLSSRWHQLQPVKASEDISKPFPKYHNMNRAELEEAFHDWSAVWDLMILKKNISPDSFSRFINERGQYAPALVDVLEQENRERNQQKIA